MADYCKTNLVDQTDDMDELLSIKILPDETVNAYLTRTDEYLAQLDSAKHSVL